MAGSASSKAGKTRFENVTPILSVRDLPASMDYYTRVLGFEKEFESPEFASVSRDGRGLYLCRGAQGRAGTWVWIGVEDVEALHEEYRASGAKIVHPPANYSWALEMRVEDPDGHMLRFGSAPREGEPFEPFHA